MKYTLIIATGNENKVREIREILNDPELSVISMKQAGIHSDPEENGTTFAENALTKARAAAELAFGPGGAVPEAQMPAVVLADDSGLVVDAMGGAPGILSARFLGRDTDYGDKMRYIMKELRDVEGEARSARFTCACAAVFPTQLLRRHPGDAAPGQEEDAGEGETEGRTVSDGDETSCRCAAPEGVRTVPGNPALSELVITRSMEGRIAYEIAGENGFGYDPFFYLPEYGKTSAEITEEEKNAVSHRGKAFRAMLKELRILLK